MRIDERPPHANSRQSTVDLLDVGESYSLARRIDLTFGLSDEERRIHTEQVRGSLESMVTRAKAKHRGRKYKVEGFTGHASTAPALFFVAVATRIS